MEWVVSGIQAKELLIEGATVLDTRPSPLWLLGHVQNAIAVSWKQFSQSEAANKGKLLSDTRILEEKLRDIGVCRDRPVIVVGNPGDRCYFGEDGRIVWMLRSLGHSATALVNGGHAALVKAGVSVVWGFPTPSPGDFVIQRCEQWEIGRDELKAQLAKSVPILLDTREAREYAGATPYGESRGGHLPGARPFYFKDLLNSEGYLRSEADILGKLKALGIHQSSPIVTYCTGGVRSAFFVVVLANIGFTNVRNYGGSTWEWSALSKDDYPLCSDQNSLTTEF